MNKVFGCRKTIDRVGILVTQLGTPAAPTSGALRRYLRQFLSDRRVIEVNPALWWIILSGIILRTRPKRSAALYKRVWTDEGSPLLVTTRSIASKLSSALAEDGIDAEVVVGMRYGEPSIESAISELIRRDCRRILLFPLYPQYAAATSGSTYDVVFDRLRQERWVPTLRVAEPYYRDPGYIMSVASLISDSISAAKNKPEKLILSYHGVPVSYVKNGDPYCCMCRETSKALISQVPFAKEDVIQTFQSRFGKEPWLTPYTDVTVEQLAKSGVKRIAVACPGFTVDCLETIDEIGHEAAALFKRAGGEDLMLIPCINDSEIWISSLRQIVKRELGSWIFDSVVSNSDDRILCDMSVS